VSAPGFALAIGLVYIAAGILGLTGELPVTNALSALYLVVGAWGCGAWAGAMGAVRYARSLTVLFAALCILNFVPALRSFFTLAPLGSAEFWLHAATAVFAAHFGFRSLARGLRRGERRHAGADRRHAPHSVTSERRRGAADRRFGGGTLSSGF
jgi:hypothetical protein